MRCGQVAQSVVNQPRKCGIEQDINYNYFQYLTGKLADPDRTTFTRLCHTELDQQKLDGK
jgi:hypothetical protein